MREYASHELSLEKEDAPPISSVYSLFSVLCILISEEYDAALVAFVENDAAPLALLLPEGTPLDAVLRDAYSIAERVRLDWENFHKKKGLTPVHTLTSYEMKICLQERGMLPHTLPAWKRSIHCPALNRVAWGNLLLSIDPFTPPELAGRKVETMLRKFQAKHVKEIE